MEDSGATHAAIHSRELVLLLSPTRRPPAYGQVFQPEGEIQRQWEELRCWAEACGRLIDSEWASRLREGREGGGEEHFVYFRGDAGFVIKETRPDSWASGAAPAQYFARWDDIGKLWPKLEAMVIGVSEAAIWTRQRFVEGEIYKDRPALDADMTRNGWLRIEVNRYQHTASGAVIRDAKPSNVIRGRDGTPWPFDVIVESTGSLE